MQKRLTAHSRRQIEALLGLVAEAPQSLLMLDYDGTLAPFRTNPEQAVPYPGIAPLLEEIMQAGRTRVVIISGRDARDVVSLLKVDPHPEIWGFHGLQRLKIDGTIELAPLDESTIQALAAAEDWLRAQHLEGTAEFKAGSIAVHWRGLSEPDSESIQERVLQGWTLITKNTHLRLLKFDGGLEIRAPHNHKGDAVRTMISEMPAGAPTAYLGDDNTDEEAFRELNGQGLSILVRARWRVTAAQVWLAPPDELLDFLNQWLQAVRQRDALGADTHVGANL